MKSNVITLFEDQPLRGVRATRFEEVWRVWPVKAKKVLAEARYQAIVNGLKTRTLDKDSGQFVEIAVEATEDEIIQGCLAYLKSQKKTGSGAFGYKDDGKYIPYLSTFLNQGRFMDHL